MQKKTVLMYAIEAKMEALCDKLIEKGADINANDRWVRDINARDDIYVAPLSPIMCGSGLQCHVTDSFALILGLLWVFNRA